jgi:hypothetical protein
MDGYVHVNMMGVLKQINHPRTHYYMVSESISCAFNLYSCLFLPLPPGRGNISKVISHKAMLSNITLAIHI